MYGLSVLLYGPSRRCARLLHPLHQDQRRLKTCHQRERPSTTAQVCPGDWTVPVAAHKRQRIIDDKYVALSMLLDAEVSTYIDTRGRSDDFKNLIYSNMTKIINEKIQDLRRRRVASPAGGAVPETEPRVVEESETE